jgi:hypothetical protein
MILYNDIPKYSIQIVRTYEFSKAEEHKIGTHEISSTANTNNEHAGKLRKHSIQNSHKNMEYLVKKINIKKLYNTGEKNYRGHQKMGRYSMFMD